MISAILATVLVISLQADAQPFACTETKPLEQLQPLVDFFGMEILSYNRWRNHTYCTFGDSTAMTHLKISVYVRNTPAGTCELCPVVPICQFLQPNPAGRYQPGCTTTTAQNEFDMHFDMPGNEIEAGIGFDPYPHIHYACCCAGSCALNTFYFDPTLDFAAYPNLGGPEADNIAVSVGPQSFEHKIIIPDYSVRWWPEDDPRDIKNLRDTYGFTLDKQMWDYSANPMVQ